MYWVYDLPNWLFSLLCIGTFSAFGVVGLLVSRAHVRRLHRVNHSHNELVSYFVAAISVFYGITLGLLAVATWTNFSDVDSKVDREAQTLASMARDVTGFPEPTRTLLRHDLQNYLARVINISWPKQRKGIIPTDEAPLLDAMQTNLMGFEPKTPREQIVLSETLHQFNDLTDARRARIDSVKMGMPAALWRLVIIGAIVTIITTLLFDVPSLAMHLWLTVLLSALLGLMVFMIAAMDNPFRGNLSVGPDALELIYQQVT